MNLSALTKNVPKLIKANSPVILTGVGVAGVITTAVFTAKGTVDALNRIKAEETKDAIAVDEGNLEPEMQFDFLPTKERRIRAVKTVWPCFIPATIAGVATIASIVGSNRVSAGRTAAAAAAAALTQEAFSEYKEKVIEQFSKGKEQKIRDEIAQKKAEAAPPYPGVVPVVAGRKLGLCFDARTARYFPGDMQKLRTLVNDFNERLLFGEAYISLSEWYEAVGLERPQDSNLMGWTEEGGLIQLDYYGVLDSEGESAVGYEFRHLVPLG